MLAANRVNEETIVPRPDNLERQPVCALSGARPSPWCPTVDSEWMPKDAPVEFCAWHHKDHIAWPAEYREWMPKRPTANSQRSTMVADALRITNPANDSTYLIDPTLRSEFQSLHLRANAEARFTVDGKAAPREWPLAPGKHVIAAMDSRGRRDEVTITVR